MPEARYDDLRVLFVNRTFELSRTGGLIDVGRGIVEKQGVTPACGRTPAW